MEFKGKFTDKKVFLILPSSQVMFEKKKYPFLGGNCCANLLCIKFTQLGLNGKSFYLTFLLDSVTPKHFLNGWMSNLLRGKLQELVLNTWSSRSDLTL